MKQTLEKELKMTAPPGFALPRFPGTALEPRRFTSTYFDTEDLRLAGLGITLRRRVENRRGLWQLKIPRGVDRLEIEEPGGPLRPPRPISSLLMAAVREKPLGPVAKMRTSRTGLLVSRDSTRVAEIVIDSVDVLDGTRIARRFGELEVELLEGDDADLKDIEVALKASGADSSDGRPKVFQALDLPLPDKGGGSRKSDSDLRLIQIAISDQFRQILSHDPGTRVGDDPEDLHQHRVGIRRLRSFLGAARPMLDPDWVGTLRDELEWIGDLMNPVRDLDVMIPHLRMDLELLEPDEARRLEPLIQSMVQERAEARTSMLAGLESARYLALMETLEEATRSIKVRPDQPGLRTGAVNAFKKLRKAARRLEAQHDDELMHLVRRLAKKARYSAELLQNTAGKPVSKFISKSKGLQDVLGEHQDAVVAEARVREYLAQANDHLGAFAVGRLVERQAARRRAARADFPDAWRAVERSGRQAWR